MNNVVVSVMPFCLHSEYAEADQILTEHNRCYEDHYNQYNMSGLPPNDSGDCQSGIYLLG